MENPNEHTAVKWRHYDVNTTSFWRHNDVIIASCVHWHHSFCISLGVRQLSVFEEKDKIQSTVNIS